MRMAAVLSESLSDEDIVERVQKGEGALFEVLMRRHNQRVYRTARAIVHDEAEVEDVMQEAYVLAYRHLDQFAGRSRFSSWLTTITAREAIARSRKMRRQPLLDDPWVDDDGQGDLVMSTPVRDPENIAIDRELATALEEAVDALPPIYRAVFVLRAVEELSAAESAEILGINEATVKTRLHRARTAIQRKLSAWADVLAPQLYPFHLSRCDRVVSAVMARLRSQA